MQDDVLTLEEVAALLKVSETTVYQLTRSGELPARKVGREWRFLRDRLLKWLAQPGVTTEGMVQRDGQGGEYKVEHGQEFIALWLPMTREEKARQIEKATREGVNISTLVADYLRLWTDE